MARNEIETGIKLYEASMDVEKNIQEQKLSLTATDMANALMADAESVYTMLGRIESAEFMATVAEKVIAETAIFLKKDKKYKNIPVKDKDGNWQHVASFEEFCALKLKLKRRRIDDLISNYNTLGPELYEQAERLGFRQRDYNALKALPADDRKLIAQAIEEENFDKALDLMQEMAAKHQREKEATDKKLTDLTERLEAKDGVIKEKTEELNKKSERINLLEAARRKDVQEEAMPGEYQLSILQDYTRTITAKISATMSSEIQKLVNEFDGLPPKHIELAIAQSLGLVITAAYGVADYWRIDPITDPEAAAEDPAKADAEAFLQWDAQQSGE